MKTLNEETLQKVREFNIVYQREYGITPSYRQIMNALRLGSLSGEDKETMQQIIKTYGGLKK